MIKNKLMIFLMINPTFLSAMPVNVLLQRVKTCSAVMIRGIAHRTPVRSYSDSTSHLTKLNNAYINALYEEKKKLDEEIEKCKWVGLSLYSMADNRLANLKLTKEYAFNKEEIQQYKLLEKIVGCYQKNLEDRHKEIGEAISNVIQYYNVLDEIREKSDKN